MIFLRAITAMLMIKQLQRKIDTIEVHNPRFARLLCLTIPASCPCQRNFNLMGYTFDVPALCEFNPLYEQLVGLRFRAIEYLAHY
ncbi:nitrogenase [Brasilonema sp. CT11]|nr:nitrogenase [Brasilonema sp. CT11]